MIVVSSVLAISLLFSISAFALSSHGETTGVGDSSEIDLSKGNVEKGDVLEKVISKEASEEQATKMQQISALSTATTCEKVENILGKPCSTRESCDLSDEWSTVTKIYKANDGEEVAVKYKYDAETDTEITSEIWLSDGCYIVSNKDYSSTTDLTTAQFLQFVKGETTYKEVVSVVGEPHANMGSGFIWDVYYTTNGDRVSILYDCHDIIDEIQIIYDYESVLEAEREAET